MLLTAVLEKRHQAWQARGGRTSTKNDSNTSCQPPPPPPKLNIKKLSQPPPPSTFAISLQFSRPSLAGVAEGLRVPDMPSIN